MDLLFTLFILKLYLLQLRIEFVNLCHKVSSLHVLLLFKVLYFSTILDKRPE